MKRHLSEPIFFTPPPTKIDRRMFKGGGSASPYYAELEKLYGEQAAMARTMRGVAEQTVIPNYQALMTDANEFDSIANRERAAAVAGADARAASSANIKGVGDELASMGANPVEWDQTLKGMGIQGAGMEAGATTGARDRIEQIGFARRKDVTGMGMGLPGQASEMMSSAGGGYGNLANMKNQDDQNTSNNIASTVQGGMNAYRIWRGKDGGFVDKKQLRGIGYAAGGPVKGRGFMTAPTPPAPPVVPQRPQGPGAGESMSVGADSAKTMYDASQGKPLSKGVGESVQWLGDKTGSTGMSEFGQGMQAGQAGLRDMATRQATQAVDSAMGNSMAQGASTYGTTAGSQQSAMLAAQDMGLSGQIGGTAADAAFTTAATAPEAAGVVAGATDAALIGGTGAELATAGTVAAEAGTAAMGGLGAAGAAIGTAVPVIGAGLAIAGLLGAFGKDGGAVHGGRGIQPSIEPAYAGGGPVQGFDPDLNRRDYITGAMGLPTGTDRKSLMLGPADPIIQTVRGAFAEGGTVQGRAPGFDGGDVNGPGGPEDDLVPAWLSDGEFVLNADAVRHFGLDKLQKMNSIGLEKRRGISKENA